MNGKAFIDKLCENGKAFIDKLCDQLIAKRWEAKLLNLLIFLSY
jgi:hypothetical protein